MDSKDGKHYFSPIRAVIKYLLMVLFGILLALGLTIIIFLSLPFLFVRVLVGRWAKVARPDLGDILNGQSVFYAVDYFSKSQPRGNLVVTSIVEGQVTCEEIKSRVMQRWINARQDNGELTYKKFQQYPVRWMGFAFWKNGMDQFNIDNHVHKLFDKNTPVTEELLTESIEKLLNSRLPHQQSPWEFYLTENYVYPHSQTKEKHSVLIFKYHHALADGFGIMTATAAIFDKHSTAKDFKPSTSPRFPNKSFSKYLLNILNRVVITVNEVFHLATHVFKNSPWKIPDERKAWHQLHIRAEPIPIQVIKDVKNKFGVSFTSVLLSALSATIWKFGVEKRVHGSVNDTELCLSMVPVPGRLDRELLTNKIAGAIIGIPCRKFGSTVDRLDAIDRLLENVKLSMFPYLSMFMLELIGRHFYPVCRFLFQNRWIPLGLSNFPGYPWKVEINGKPVIDNSFTAGALAGDTGVGVTVLGHGEKIRIGISTEEGLMTRQQARLFVRYVTDEINLLHNMLNNN